MYVAAASTAAVFLIAVLPFIGDIHSIGRWDGHLLTATPLTITLVIVAFVLVLIALWLWMARAVGRGRNWARITSTVLFVLSTDELQGEHGVAVGVLRRADLADRPGRGVAAVASGLPRVLQAIPAPRRPYGHHSRPSALPPASRPATFVPWADVEQIILYTGYQGRTPAPWIGIRRREGTPPLPSGNEQAPFCPVPGVAAGATRLNKGLRLDRERLAAVTATVAPGISVIETSADSGPGPGVA